MNTLAALWFPGGSTGTILLIVAVLAVVVGIYMAVRSGAVDSGTGRGPHAVVTRTRTASRPGGHTVRPRGAPALLAVRR